MKKFLPLLIFFLLASFVYAEGKHRHLNPQDIDRVKLCQKILLGIDERSLDQMINDLESSQYPQANLIMLEAMARAYTDVANDLKIVEKDSQKRLLNKVKLNMAYLQLNNFDKSSNGSEPLSRLIVHKLKQHLPPDPAIQPGFGYSLE